MTRLTMSTAAMGMAAFINTVREGEERVRRSHYTQTLDKLQLWPDHTAWVNDAHMAQGDIPEIGVPIVPGVYKTPNMEH